MPRPLRDGAGFSVMSEEYGCEMLEAFESALEVLNSGDASSCVFTILTLGKQAVTNGRRYDCISSISPDAFALIPGGMLSDYQFSMSARLKDFPTLPISGDKI